MCNVAIASAPWPVRGLQLSDNATQQQHASSKGDFWIPELDGVDFNWNVPSNLRSFVAQLRQTCPTQPFSDSGKAEARARVLAATHELTVHSRRVAILSKLAHQDVGQVGQASIGLQATQRDYPTCPSRLNVQALELPGHAWPHLWTLRAGQ